MYCQWFWPLATQKLGNGLTNYTWVQEQVMERSLKSDPEPDNKEDSWPFRPLGERVAAGSRAYSKKRLTAFFLFSELDQFTELALVRVMSKECVAPAPNLGLILHLPKTFFLFFLPAPAAAEGQFHGGAGWGGSQATSCLSFYWSVPVCQAQEADWRVRFSFWTMCFAPQLQQNLGFSQQF